MNIKHRCSIRELNHDHSGFKLFEEWPYLCTTVLTNLHYEVQAYRYSTKYQINRDMSMFLSDLSSIRLVHKASSIVVQNESVPLSISRRSPEECLRSVHLIRTAGLCPILWEFAIC